LTAAQKCGGVTKEGEGAWTTREGKELQKAQPGEVSYLKTCRKQLAAGAPTLPGV
jgi:hypothetical protein